MHPGLVFGAVAAGGVAAWYGLYWLVRLATRPVRPRAAPATPELGEEPPAVVNLLVNRWELTRDAEQATLLDLAARGLVELKQQGDDPAMTAVRPLGGDLSTLTAFERRVLARVEGLTSRGPVPVAGLAFRSESEASAWNQRLRGEILTEARRRGLSRRRFGAFPTGLLVAAGILIGLVMMVAAAAAVPPGDDGGSVPAVFVVGLALAAFGLRYPGERDTPAGRAAAAHWLGVRESLRASGSIEYMPPAAAVHWGRQLAYGAALGVARTSGSVLDLGLGSRTLVWSQFGGTWHRVGVRYPQRLRRYGRTAGNLVKSGLIQLAVGVVVLVFYDRPREWLGDVDAQLAPDELFDLLEPGAVAVAVLLLVIAAYTLVRTAVDRAMTATITGELLWLEDWQNDPSGTPLSYVVIDDGTRDRTTAWLAATELTKTRRDGDTVRITVTPWTRRIRKLDLVRRSTRPVEPDGDVNLDRVMSAHAGDRVAAGALRASVWIDRTASWLGGSPYRADPLPLADLLTSPEVGRALGSTVNGPTVPPGSGRVAFNNRTGEPVLYLTAQRGIAARLAWRQLTRGTPVPGLGKGAFVTANRGAVRVRRTVLVLTLADDGQDRSPVLRDLLTKVAQRVEAIR